VYIKRQNRQFFQN